jgi:hypothetical protein
MTLSRVFKVEGDMLFEVGMIVTSLQFLTHSNTYQELALRCQEFLQYQHHQDGSEQRQLAEDMLFNLLVEYMVQSGVPREKAETYCGDDDNLMELAMRISSALGPG